MLTFRVPEQVLPSISWKDTRYPLLASVVLVVLSFASYPLFHAAVDFLTVTLGILLFLIARSTFPVAANAFLMCVASGFFWASLLDIFHGLSDQGVISAQGFRPDTAELFRLAGRTVQILALVMAPHFLGREVLPKWVFPSLAGGVAMLLFVILIGWVPDLYSPEGAISAFKALWEWVLVISLLWSVINLQAHRPLLPEGVFHVTLIMLLLLGVAELCSTLYEDNASVGSVLGYLAKVWAYLLVLWLISSYMLVQPKRLLKYQSRLLQEMLARVPGMAFQLHRSPSGELHFGLASTGVSEIFELTPEEVLDSAATALDRINAADRQVLLKELGLSSQNLTPWRCEWQADLPRQGRRWHRAESSAPQLQEDGSCYWIGHIHDITEQKTLKEDLVEHRDHLARMVSEQTRELRLAMLQVEEAAKARSDFLSKVSHEIRTPLNGIIGMAQVGIRANLPKQATNYLEQILDSGEILLSLVNDILDVAKIEAGKLKIEHIQVNLPVVIERAVRLTAHRAEVKHLRLEVELAPDLPQGVMGDEIRLVQILVNLLGNAIKFTEKGYVKLKVSCAKGVGDQRWLQISVEDTGIGMNSEQIDRLFAPFEQGDDSTAREYGGTGLGLAICKQIVDLMHGALHVASRVSHGSCFMVRLPYEEVELPAEPVAEAPLSGDGCVQRLVGCRILVAEDEPVNQWVLRELLEQEGAIVRVFDDGRPLVEAVEQGEVADLVLTDIQMPELDGYLTTRQLKTLRPALPVIGLTAFAMPEERERCLEAGMHEHVSKPIDIEVLVSAIQRALWAPQADGQNSRETEVIPRLVEADVPPGLNWEGLWNRFKNVRMLEKMLHSFVVHHERTAEQFVLLTQNNEVEATGMLAHRLKGVAGLLEAKHVMELASQLEGHIKTKHEIEVQVAQSLIEALRTLVAAAQSGLHYLAGQKHEYPTS